MKPFHLTRVGMMSRAFVMPSGYLNTWYLRLRGYAFDNPWSPRLMTKARLWERFR